MTVDAIEATYQQRADRFAAWERSYCSRELWVMHLRVAAFVLALALFFFGWKAAEGRPWFWAGGVAIGVFCALVAYHEYVRDRILRYGILRRINEEAIGRLHRRWAAFPETPVMIPPECQAVSTDLDLFGHASLFHLLCSANTPLGIGVLRDWLLKPAAPDEIPRRQRAVADLAPELELRQMLVLEGRLLAERGKTMERFVEWAEAEPWLAARPWLLWTARALAVAVALIPALMGFGVVSVPVGSWALISALCMNVALIALFSANVHDLFAPLRSRRGEARRYFRMFELMHSMPDSDSELDAVKREATELGGGALLRMRQMDRTACFVTLTHDPLLRLCVYLPLQFFFLYDFHVLNRLEAWQARYGKFVRRWFVALGKFEAFSSLATLAYDHPSWIMPQVDASADRVQARGLGHPLLPCATRVDNDVEIGPAGSFLLITGSNMSGKSTLLRAVGVNVVLAQAGAPVCAEAFAIPPIVLATSMRIRDSLEDGVSFYMAELMRLKEVVDLARGAQSSDGRVLLYLLDEILLGTNSKERHIAVVRVLHHLLRCGAIGAISTHDLDLAASEPLAGLGRCVHFCETLHDSDAERPMTFDYRLRPGLATTTNALRLLEIVGLGERRADSKVAEH